MSKEVAKRPSFSMVINQKKYQEMINRTLQDKSRAQRFVSSIVSAVSVNPALQECTPISVVSGALQGEALNLSPSPQLGHFYLVPYEDKKAGEKKAVFQPGYRGILQLAMRSGQYKSINVVTLKEGELKKWNMLTEEADIEFIEDDEVRENEPVMGYIATFEYMNGFRKTIYWSREKMVNHADRYSPAFSKNATTGKYPKVSFDDYCKKNYPASDEWKYSSFWYKDFDAMAHKTMLKQLISKWGIMSVEMQTAFEADNETVDNNYIDVTEVPVNGGVEPVETEAIETTGTVSLGDVQ